MQSSAEFYAFLHFLPYCTSLKQFHVSINDFEAVEENANNVDVATLLVSAVPSKLCSLGLDSDSEFASFEFVEPTSILRLVRLLESPITAHLKNLILVDLNLNDARAADQWQAVQQLRAVCRRRQLHIK